MIYQKTNRQVVMAPMGGPVDIHIPAVKIVMDMYEIEDQRDCLERIQILFQNAKKDEE